MLVVGGGGAWRVAVGCAVCGGQGVPAQAVRVGDGSAVLAVDLLKLVWGTAVGFIFFLEVPDIWTLAGGVMIFSTTTYLALREFRTNP